MPKSLFQSKFFVSSNFIDKNNEATFRTKHFKEIQQFVIRNIFWKNKNGFAFTWLTT